MVRGTVPDVLLEVVAAVVGLVGAGDGGGIPVELPRSAFTLALLAWLALSGLALLVLAVVYLSRRGDG